MWDLVPWPGLELRTLHWKCRVLATGPPGKSRKSLFLALTNTGKPTWSYLRISKTNNILINKRRGDWKILPQEGGSGGRTKAEKSREQFMVESRWSFQKTIRGSHNLPEGLSETEAAVSGQKIWRGKGKIIIPRNDDGRKQEKYMCLMAGMKSLWEARKGSIAISCCMKVYHGCGGRIWESPSEFRKKETQCCKDESDDKGDFRDVGQKMYSCVTPVCLGAQLRPTLLWPHGL